MRFFLNKHLYIKVITFKTDKSMTVEYFTRSKFKPKYLVNPDHIFLSNGYTTIVRSETSAETMNPLDFKSKYDVKKFQTAINSKIIDETFSNLKTSKFDLTQIILFLSLAINFIVLYFILKSQGVF